MLESFYWRQENSKKRKKIIEQQGFYDYLENIFSKHKEPIALKKAIKMTQLNLSKRIPEMTPIDKKLSKITLKKLKLVKKII